MHFTEKTRNIHGKRVLFFMLLLFVNTFSCGISSIENSDPIPIWSFEPEAIHIRYRADETLNFFNNMPHTLILIIYQLSVIDTFNGLAKNEDGLKKLLRGVDSDPGIVRKDTFIVQPGEENVIVLDRGENAKWVCVVAGYYHLIPGLVSQVYQIPVKTGILGRIRKRKFAHIEHLQTNLLLGKNELFGMGTH